MMNSRAKWLQRVSPGLCLLLFSTSCLAAPLYVGGASVNITPEGPVAVDGQMYTRISSQVESPCIATALAIETRDGDRSIDQAIFVSCDLCVIRGGRDFYNEVFAKLGDRLGEFPLDKIVLNATHTHTCPLMDEGRYELPETGIMQPAEYRDYLADRLANIIEAAWNSRAPGKAAWGLGFAVVAKNRRSIHQGGSAIMYGKTDRADFRGIEGGEDHGVEILYFWDEEGRLIATAINVACPAQDAAMGTNVNADFWHDVRENLRAKHGADLLVIAWTGAGGDASPRLMHRLEAEKRMLKLRGLSSLQEYARRITDCWEDVLPVVAPEATGDVEFQHLVKTIKLPYRLVTRAEYESAKKALEKVQQEEPERRKWKSRWHGSVIDRYEQQQTRNPEYEMVLHALRLGDVAIVTNDFELFSDFGIQMKARAPALQTFVIELCGAGTYVPTQRAVDAGGYSAIAESSIVGPIGGQALVEETLTALEELWRSSASATRRSAVK